MLPTAAVVAVKVAEAAAAGTTTDAGTLRAGSVLVRVTVAPVGAAWFRTTVQTLLPFGPRLEGAQDSEETSTGATRLMVALAELLL